MDREYHLKCKVQKIRQNYVELSDKRLHEASAIVLIPDPLATETSMFLTEYLPDVSTVCLDCGTDDLRIYYTECPKCGGTKIKTEFAEVPAWIAAPVNSPCRLAVLRKNNYCTEHHLFVMSTGVEEDLKLMDGKTINLTILPLDQDAVTDAAKSIERTAHKIEF